MTLSVCAVRLIKPEVLLAIVADGRIPLEEGCKGDSGAVGNGLAGVTIYHDMPGIAVLWLALVRVCGWLRPGLGSGGLRLLD